MGIFIRGGGGGLPVNLGGGDLTETLPHGCFFLEISCVAQQSIDGEVVFTDRMSSVSQVVFPPQPTAIQEVSYKLSNLYITSIDVIPIKVKYIE